MGQGYSSIPSLVELVGSGSDKQKERAAWTLWDLSYENAAKAEKIASAGGIPPLIELVRSGNYRQKEFAIRALSNLSLSGASQEKIASADGIPPIVELVRSGSLGQKINAATALWNLALHQPKLRGLIVAQRGAVDQLVNLASEDEDTDHLRLLAAGVLGFLASHLPSDVKLKVAIEGGIEVLMLFIFFKSENAKERQERLIALRGLCSDGNDTIRAIVKSLDGEKNLGLIRKSDNEKNRILAGHILEWLEGDFTDLSEKCQRMGEAAPLCSHVMERIKALLDSGVDSVGAARARLRAVLAMNGDKSMVVRVVSARSLSETLADLHRGIDVLLPEASRDAWRSQWELDRSAMMHRLFTCDIPTLINSLGDAAAQEEAFTLLVHEVKKNKRAYTKPERDFLKELTTRLLGFSSGCSDLKTMGWFIPRSDVQVNDVSFNRGAFGKIYHGKYMNADVVIKCVDIKSERDRENFLREVNVWHEASRHPNIVPLFGACHVGDPCFMVCKFIADGSLRDHLYRHKNERRLKAWQALLDVTHGLQLLHSKGFVHGDVKGDNILVEADTAMLTDFGMSFHGSGSQPEFDNLGALRWRAPEFIATKKASFEADVYSLGMCVIEAVAGKVPWGIVPDSAVKVHLKNKKLPRQPKSLSDDEWALVCAMCDFDPAKRMKLPEVEKRIREFVDMEEEKATDRWEMQEQLAEGSLQPANM